MDLYRSSWITERDFQIIKSFRFNVVRLPMNYRQFEDDSKPFHLRSDAWKWTDKAIALAKKYGISYHSVWQIRTRRIQTGSERSHCR